MAERLSIAISAAGRVVGCETTACVVAGCVGATARGAGAGLSHADRLAAATAAQLHKNLTRIDVLKRYFGKYTIVR
jgi:predicted nucleic acid-binding protein